MGTEDHSEPEFASPSPWLPKRVRYVLLVIALAVILVSVVVVVVQRSKRCGGHKEITRQGPRSECIGVTDGQYPFDPSLAEVEKKIYAENRWVLNQRRQYVTVAFLAAMSQAPPGKGSENPIEGSLIPRRQQLEGAYVGQYRANHGGLVGDSPLIRLVLANEGSDEREWKGAVSEIKRMTDAPDQLRAVVGLGVSRQETTDGAQELAKKDILMVGAVITANKLDSTTISGLVRVAPTNNDEAAAAVAYLKPDVHTVMLVEDTYSHDTYVQTLAQSFQSLVPKSGRTLLDPPEIYNASRPGVGNRFEEIATTICVSKPDVVFFAGRGEALGGFVKALGARPCNDPVFVLTGDDAETVSFDDREVQVALKGTSSKAAVTLTYTALAHPDQWTSADAQHQVEPPTGFQGFLQLVMSTFPRDSPPSGDAMMAHDAVLTAVQAIRGFVGQTGNVPDPGEVLQALAGLHVPHAVPGASGLIQIDPTTGNPIGKPVPILSLQPDGKPKFLQLIFPH